jgi:AraC-like DNA-binding protein
MIMEIKMNDTIRAFFYSIIPYFSQKLPPSEALLELRFKELLFNVLMEPGNLGILAYAYYINEKNGTPLWQIVESNYMFNLTIAEFARMSNKSVTSFNKEFQEYYNTTPGKWLTNRRLEHARLLLKSSKKNISEIVYNTGFENISHFSRVFKEKYRLSPLQYRKNEQIPSEI